jgi:hypothetical protein
MLGELESKSQSTATRSYLGNIVGVTHWSKQDKVEDPLCRLSSEFHPFPTDSASDQRGPREARADIEQIMKTSRLSLSP